MSAVVTLTFLEVSLPVTVAVKYANVVPTTAVNKVATAITLKKITFFFSIILSYPPL